METCNTSLRRRRFFAARRSTQRDVITLGHHGGRQIVYRVQLGRHPHSARWRSCRPRFRRLSAVKTGVSVDAAVADPIAPRS